MMNAAVREACYRMNEAHGSPRGRQGQACAVDPQSVEKPRSFSYDERTMSSGRFLQNGQRLHLVDKKGRQYALTLKAGETFQYSGETIPHDELIGKADGSLVTLSRGKRM